MLKAYHMESLKVVVLHKTQDSQAAQVWLYNVDSLLWLLLAYVFFYRCIYYAEDLNILARSAVWPVYCSVGKECSWAVHHTCSPNTYVNASSRNGN